MPANRLARESSPYLLQHADNPVDWRPWGEEAFEEARKRDVPVFLSIGYATCHWCHVMAHETFEDAGAAAILNEGFVPVKVDREERPDVDAVYMAAVQAMTGQGGWPLSVFLSPDGRPFFGGTYFPLHDGYGRPGFLTVLKSVSDGWRDRREELVESAEQLTNHLRAVYSAPPGGEPGEEALTAAGRLAGKSFDSEHGGFGGAPKFPRAHQLSLLLRMSDRFDDPEILRIVTRTLDAIRRGGIHDHVGGGYHRYSTDRRWHVPHFEKMLYDQALLATAFLETYQATGRERFADAARDVIDYVLRDLSGPAGAFYSAEDADSEGEEGRFYLWTADEIEEVLGAEDGKLFSAVYGVAPDGNVTVGPDGTRSEGDVLFLSEEIDDAADRSAVDAATLHRRLAEMREKLRQARESRPRPLLDDKVLTDWNGLAIGAMALAGRTLDHEPYVDAALRAATFVAERLVQDGHLLHRYRNGVAGIPGFLSDHAFLALGLVELYEASFEERWLEWAGRLCREIPVLFAREDDAAFTDSGRDGERLVLAPRSLYDGAIPSGNSAAALALVRTGRLLGDRELVERGGQALSAFSETLSRMPDASPVALTALDLLLGPAAEVVVAGERESPEVRELVGALRRRFLPRTAVVLHPPGVEGERIRSLVPSTKGKDPVNGKPAAYVCRDYTCRRPVTSAKELERQLAKESG